MPKHSQQLIEDDLMSAKERVKAVLFVVSLLTIGHIGNFPPFLFENADAQGGSVQQWSVTWTEYDRVLSSVDRGMTIKSCPYCGNSRLARRYEATVADFEITRNCLNDGIRTMCMQSERQLPGTQHLSNFYEYFDHLHGSGSECGG